MMATIPRTDEIFMSARIGNTDKSNGNRALPRNGTNAGRFLKSDSICMENGIPPVPARALFLITAHVKDIIPQPIPAKRYFDTGGRITTTV